MFRLPEFPLVVPSIISDSAGNFPAGLHWKKHGAASCSFKMISFSNINKQYGKQLLFVDASFQLNPGEKVGLVGPNGAGKTTLFRMVVGEETPDEGAVSVPKKLTIGYFRQDVEEMQGRSVLDEAIAGSGRVGDLHHELEALQREMSDPDKADDMDRILDRFGHVQEEYEHLGGYALESQAREVLHGLGFKDDQIDGDVGALSGGWKMRVALARVLLGMPDVLLMDEPTNHLDIESIIWLEQFLKSFPGALLMTSHDREFMNRLVSKIAEIDGGEIITYSGDYDFYERERAVRESNHRQHLPGSSPCLPRSSASLIVSGRTPPKRPRCRAGSRPWIRSRRSNCPKNGRS
jgi:ATPase subunit of ABC transporter with duplicated ATPase domains